MNDMTTMCEDCHGTDPEDVENIISIGKKERKAVIDMLGYKRFTGEYPTNKDMFLFGYDDIPTEHRQKSGKVKPIHEACHKCDKSLMKADGIYAVNGGSLGFMRSHYYCKTCAKKTEMMKSLDKFK